MLQMWKDNPKENKSMMTTPSQQIIEAIAEKWAKQSAETGAHNPKENAGVRMEITANVIKSAITEANAELLKRVEELEREVLGLIQYCDSDITYSVTDIRYIKGRLKQSLKETK